MKVQYIVVFVTCADKKEAANIAHLLVAKKLVACVNIIGKIESLFWWKGKVDKAKETLLIAKSRRSLFAKIIRLVKSAHSYQVPEIIALPIITGDKAYLKWIDECRA